MVGLSMNSFSCDRVENRAYIGAPVERMSSYVMNIDIYVGGIEIGYFGNQQHMYVLGFIVP